MTLLYFTDTKQIIDSNPFHPFVVYSYILNSAIMRKYLSPTTILLVTTLVVNTFAFADEPKQSKKQQQEAAVKQMVEQQKYTFIAQSALPLGGPTKQLSYGYNMRVAKDTVAAYLPYYGRGYVAPMDMTGGGVDFTSTDFDYQTKATKKGWDITISIKDDMEHRYELLLFVSKSGTATLQVNDNTRQSISFYGEVQSK